MGLYIKGMDMPKTLGVNVTIYPDGRVIEFRGNGVKEQLSEAVEVKAPHGRMIDADAAIKSEQPSNVTDDQWAQTTLARCINNAPTIIEAEGKDDG